MKFSTKEDIEAPIDVVFQRVSDFSQFERQAMRRGASVKKLQTGPAQNGTQWDVAFTYRGKERVVRGELQNVTPPNGYQIKTISAGIEGLTLVDLVALSPKRTRLSVSIDLSPKSISARLIIQSLRLAKGTLSQRFKKRIAGYAEDIESRYKTGH